MRAALAAYLLASVRSWKEIFYLGTTSIGGDVRVFCTALKALCCSTPHVTLVFLNRFEVYRLSPGGSKMGAPLAPNPETNLRRQFIIPNKDLTFFIVSGALS